MQLVKKQANSDEIKAIVEIDGLSSFPFPKLDKTIAIEMMCLIGMNGTELNGSLIKSWNSVFYKYGVINNRRLTAMVMRNNGEDHEGFELYTRIRRELIEILRLHGCVSLWIGDVNGSLVKSTFKFKAPYEQTRRELNKLIAGTKWTRTMLFVLEGHPPLVAWADEHNDQIIRRHELAKQAAAKSLLNPTWGDLRNGLATLT
jgi:hypothetical protein